MHGLPAVVTDLEEILDAYEKMGSAVSGEATAGAVIGGALVIAHEAVTGRTLQPGEIKELVVEASQWLFCWAPLADKTKVS